jgi:hypothetical protein
MECVWVLYFVYQHARTADGLEGFSRNLKKQRKKEFVRSERKKSESSTRHLAVRINFKPANDKPTTTPRASKKNGVEV